MLRLRALGQESDEFAVENAATRACSDIKSGADPDAAIEQRADEVGLPAEVVAEEVEFSCVGLPEDLPDASLIEKAKAEAEGLSTGAMVGLGAGVLGVLWLVLR